MYNFLLYTHSWLRWIIIGLAIINIIKSYTGWKSGTAFDKKANALSASFVGVLDLTALVGILLYFFYSPFAFKAFGSGASVMGTSSIRYWAVEHVFIMVVAIAIAHIGRAKTKKIADSAKKYKTQFIFFLIAFVLMLSRIPFNEAGRLFRL